jgi:nucleoside-diphosphate-sugar epimerase
MSKSQLSFGPDLSFINADCSATELQEIFSKLGINNIVHAATHFTRSRQTEAVSDVIRANFDFSVRVFEAGKAVGANFINFNSFWQLEKDTDGLGLYAATKEAFRHYLEISASSTMEVYDIYIPETFGPHDPRDKLVANLIRARMEGQKYELQNPDLEIDLSYGPFLADFVSRLVLDQPRVSSRTAYVNFPGLSIGKIQQIIMSLPGEDEVVRQGPRPIGIRGSKPQERTLANITFEGAMPNSSLSELLSYTYLCYSTRPLR